ncbi:hypothetical protein HCG51_00230 [Tolypothrix sp. PCC 7910]|uniref:hypothetical protein n=1 Tax=Tolypothrix sp. PCC 7910 TaxID=2099387 RepID=UPI00142780C4|nr:hypothetical protein [Tolypothrix sp. PCC 7910]QIR35329.1 hypothetical protein HCG51_00230 [Tolypothrix sp. PCC 7910]
MRTITEAWGERDATRDWRGATRDCRDAINRVSTRVKSYFSYHAGSPLGVLAE